MEREEFNSSHYVAGRLAIWCAVCGAPEGKGCVPWKHIGFRFESHNKSAIGRPAEPIGTVTITPARKDAPKKGWTPQGWM